MSVEKLKYSSDDSSHLNGDEESQQVEETSESEARLVYLLSNEDRCSLLLEASTVPEGYMVNLWRAIQEFRVEEDERKRKNFLVSILGTSFARPDSECSQLVAPGTVKALRGVVEANSGVEVAVVGPLEREVVAYLMGSGLLDRSQSTPLKVRAARDWVLGGTQGDESQAERERLERRWANMKHTVETGDAAELQAALSVLLPLLVVYHAPVEDDVSGVFARLEVVDPLCATTLRRKALVVSYLATHRRQLSAPTVATLTKTVSTFHLESSKRVPEARSFTNAVEAFAQGRNFNKMEKSMPDISELITGVHLFEPLRQSDPVLRKQLLDAEHAFEASRVMAGAHAHQLYWNWALHYAWVAQCTLSKRPVMAGMFMVEAMKQCEVAISQHESHLKPLLLWGHLLATLLQPHNASSTNVSFSLFAPLLAHWGEAYIRYTEVRPFEADVAPLQQVATIPIDASHAYGEVGAEHVAKVMARTLRGIVAMARGHRIRMEAAALWLQLHQHNQVTARTLNRILAQLSPSPSITHVMLHMHSFVMVVRHLYHRSSSSSPVEPRVLPSGDANTSMLSVRRFEGPGREKSLWLPDPSVQAAQVIREQDPKKLYHFTGVIGKGAFGQVSVARRKNDKLPVAIKETFKPLSECREEVMAEVQVMQMCNNEYIVHFVEALSYRNHVYMVMLYCDGGALDTVIDNVTLTEPVLAHIFHCVTLALQYLERIVLVHRDVKPANILLSRNGAIRLGDLGLVKPQVECQFRSSRAGTPCFRAPEVLLGLGSTTKSDMFSLACAIYNAFYASRPFQSASSVQRLWDVTTMSSSSPPPPPPKSATRLPSAALMALMEGCFRRDPAERFSAADALKQPFFALDTPEVRREVREICDATFLEESLATFM